MRQTLVNIGVPILVYLPGAVHMAIDEWHYACLAPCFAVITAPMERTFALTGEFFGLIGQVVLALIVLAWVVNFMNQIVRGMPAAHN